jgi:TonB family protein
VHVQRLARADAGTMTAEFSFAFGTREALRSVLPVRPGRPLLFAGHLDSTLPILSVITLEFRMFPSDRKAEMQEFAGMAKKDRDAFTPPPPKQREEEPYIPGIEGVTMPERISFEKPVYPDAARPEKLDGQVIVEVTVDREGKAIHPRILQSSSPVFDSPAFESAKTYRYKPATKDGKPVAVTMNLIMIFQFTARPAP